jgi:hypothetical protein
MILFFKETLQLTNSIALLAVETSIILMRISQTHSDLGLEGL